MGTLDENGRLLRVKLSAMRKSFFLLFGATPVGGTLE